MKSFRRRARIFSLALASAFVVVLSATCLAEARGGSAEQACCASMATCGAAMAQDHQCCRTELPRVDAQLAATRIAVTMAPAPVSAADILFDDVAPIAGDLKAASRAPADSPPRSAPPTYLVLSVFRV